jgi:hypothetical protein
MTIQFINKMITLLKTLEQTQSIKNEIKRLDALVSRFQ